MNPRLEPVLTVDYAKKNLQNASFRDENLINTSFHHSDLRGADFSNANLKGADLTSVKTGITPRNTFFVFFAALVVSMFSGYVAMLAGSTVQEMLNSSDFKLRAAGVVSLVMILLTLVYYYWKGGRSVIRHLIIPAFLISVTIGTIVYFSGLSTGKGMFFLSLSLLLTVIMITIGTVARGIAGSLSSSAIFILVGAGGSLFGSNIGGGIGTVILAISCALISKRALSGAKGFEALNKIMFFVTSKFGTSFRNANLSGTNFSNSVIHNADFTGADLTTVQWGNSYRENCILIGDELPEAGEYRSKQ